MEYEITGLEAKIIWHEPPWVTLHLTPRNGDVTLKMKRQQLERLRDKITAALIEKDSGHKDHSRS